MTDKQWGVKATEIIEATQALGVELCIFGMFDTSTEGSAPLHIVTRLPQTPVPSSPAEMFALAGHFDSIKAYMVDNTTKAIEQLVAQEKQRMAEAWAARVVAPPAPALAEMDPLVVDTPVMRLVESADE